MSQPIKNGNFCPLISGDASGKVDIFLIASRDLFSRSPPPPFIFTASSQSVRPPTSHVERWGKQDINARREKVVNSLCSSPSSSSFFPRGENWFQLKSRTFLSVGGEGKRIPP